MDGVPSLPSFQFFRSKPEDPRGMTDHDLRIGLLVHHELSRADIVEQKPRLLEGQIIRVSARRVPVLVDADDGGS